MKSILRKVFYLKCVMFDYVLRDNKARILMYHSHLIPNVFFNVAPAELAWQLDYLQSKGYRFVKISDLITMIKEKKSLRKVVAITYDDGHRDFVTTALPEFEKRNIPVTLYWPKGMEGDVLVTSNGVSCPLLSAIEVEQLKQNKLVEIGSHGVTHKEFAGCEDGELEVEIARAEERSIAYPRGKFGAREMAAVQHAGYEAAVTTIPGWVTHSSNLFALPRISVDQATNHLAFRAKLSTLYGLYGMVRAWMVR